MCPDSPVICNLREFSRIKHMRIILGSLGVAMLAAVAWKAVFGVTSTKELGQHRNEFSLEPWGKSSPHGTWKQFIIEVKWFSLSSIPLEQIHSHWHFSTAAASQDDPWEAGLRRSHLRNGWGTPQRSLSYTCAQKKLPRRKCQDQHRDRLRKMPLVKITQATKKKAFRSLHLSVSLLAVFVPRVAMSQWGNCQPNANKSASKSERCTRDMGKSSPANGTCLDAAVFFTHFHVAKLCTNRESWGASYTAILVKILDACWTFP